MQTVLLLAGVLFHEAPIRKVCEAVGFPFEHLVYPQLAAGERSVSSQQAFDLVALAESARKDPRVRRILTEVPPDDHVRLRARSTARHSSPIWTGFSNNYGHRGRYESDWSLPRLHEDPTPIFQAMRAHLSDDARPAGTGDDSIA